MGFLPLLLHFLERASWLWFIQLFAHLFLTFLGGCYYSLHVKWLSQTQERLVPSRWGLLWKVRLQKRPTREVGPQGPGLRASGAPFASTSAYKEFSVSEELWFRSRPILPTFTCEEPATSTYHDGSYPMNNEPQ